jgi:type IV pilus assembly protein PilM
MANFFNFLANSFSQNKDVSVVGIDIGSSAIKMVQLQKRKGRAVLETYGELALGPYMGLEIGKATRLSTEKTVLALTDLFREANITTRNAGVAIPMRQSMVSVLTLPTKNPNELKTMVPIEARKYIPMPISEVTLDWFAVPKRNEAEEAVNSTDILAVAIHNDTLSQFSAIVQQAQIQATFFEVELFSTVRSVVDVQETKPVMIFDMGAGATKLYVIERGVVRDSHTINRGGQDITASISRALNVSVEFAEQLKRNSGKNNPDQEKAITEVRELVMNPIFNETSAVLLNYERKANKAVSKIVLVGGGVLLKGIREAAEQYLRIPVENGNPFEKVEAPAFLEKTLSETGPGFATAIGLALRKLQDSD